MPTPSKYWPLVSLDAIIRSLFNGPGRVQCARHRDIGETRLALQVGMLRPWSKTSKSASPIIAEKCSVGRLSFLR